MSSSINLQSLPSEVHSQILEWLPVSPRLFDLAYLCKGVFYPWLMNEKGFAKHHVNLSFAREKKTEDWSTRSRRSSQSKYRLFNYDDWLHVSAAYRAPLLVQLVNTSESYFGGFPVSHSTAVEIMGIALNIAGSSSNSNSISSSSGSIRSCEVADSKWLLWAIRGGHTAAVELWLTENELDEDLADETLIQAMEGNSAETVAVLLGAGGRPQKSVDTLINRVTVRNDNVAVVLAENVCSSEARASLFDQVCAKGLILAAGRILGDADFEPPSKPVLTMDSVKDSAFIFLLLNDARVSTGHVADFAITTACAKGPLRLVKELITGDRKINPACNNQTPIYEACRNGQADIVQYLLQHPEFHIDPSTSNNRCLRTAVKQGRTAIVQHLSSHSKVDVSARNQEAIVCAASHFNGAGIVGILLKDPRCDPSVNGNQALRDACQRGNLETVKLLLGHPKVDPSVNQNELIGSYSLAIANLILMHPLVDPSAFGNRALKDACRKGLVLLVDKLLNDPRVLGNLSVEELDQLLEDPQFNHYVYGKRVHEVLRVYRRKLSP
ncbi:ankyrin repeat-containing domain protein [Obelidium mucronatum]|nr:ankyrin repeat-containing domain protein [Obelidium mucronatum]